MAMCLEGGTGADIEYVTPSDNRGAGSWVGNQLEGYTDGTRVFFVIDGGLSGSTKQVAGSSNVKASTATPKPTATTEPEVDEAVYYQNCSAVKSAGKAPLYEGDPGYSTKLDRDKDGVACEK